MEHTRETQQPAATALPRRRRTRRQVQPVALGSEDARYDQWAAEDAAREDGLRDAQQLAYDADVAYLLAQQEGAGLMDQQLVDAASLVLIAWGLEAEHAQFLADKDGLALLALLGNQAAKLAELRGEHAAAQRLYAVKPLLLRRRLTAPGAGWWATPHPWGAATTVIFVQVGEPVGSLAFHVAGDEPELVDLLANAPDARGRRWDGVPKQGRAGTIARSWLRHRTPS